MPPTRRPANDKEQITHFNIYNLQTFSHIPGSRWDTGEYQVAEPLQTATNLGREDSRTSFSSFDQPYHTVTSERATEFQQRAERHWPPVSYGLG